MTSEELDRLEALCDGATEGPWRVQADDADPVGPKDGFQPFGGCGCCGSPWVNGETKDERNANAALIAASREALPALIAEVRTLRAELDAMRGVVEAAEAVRNDLVQRAEWEPEYVEAKRRDSNAAPVVACGNGVWSDLCAALDALKAQQERES